MSDHPVLRQARSQLFTTSRARSNRASSADRSGANQDFIRVGTGEMMALMEHTGPGCITHMYFAMVLPDLRDYRDAILRCFWDGNNAASVEVPLGDFFGLSHGRTREFASLMVTVNAGFGSSHGLNSYFSMPFSDGARVTIENRGPNTLGGAVGALWYHIDYETYAEPLPEGIHRFHASYRQEYPTSPSTFPANVTLHDAANLDGHDNYVALDTVGQGRMVGLHLEIENVQDSWYGEGDDMVFIDGEVWPPSIHGTGSEEIFGGGACPSTEYAGPYTGFHLVESPRYNGLVGMYRWYLEDPIHFETSLRWTIEHGHANNYENNYASIAYWYQTPAASLPPLPTSDMMLPPLGKGYEEARELLFETAGKARAAAAAGEAPLIDYLLACQAGGPLYLGDWEAAVQGIRGFLARDSSPSPE